MVPAKHVDEDEENSIENFVAEWNLIREVETENPSPVAVELSRPARRHKRNMVQIKKKGVVVIIFKFSNLFLFF